MSPKAPLAIALLAGASMARVTSDVLLKLAHRVVKS